MWWQSVCTETPDTYHPFASNESHTGRGANPWPNLISCSCAAVAWASWTFLFRLEWVSETS